MSYAEFKGASKAPVTSDQIGNGQIELRHLSPELFTEIRKLPLHSHTGQGSKKVNVRNLEGSFGNAGFLIYSSDGTKRYQVTVNSATGAFVLTEV
jgi:hypothetical protein